MGVARGCHFLCLRAFLTEPALSGADRAVAVTMDPFFSELSSLTDDPDLYSLDLDSIQLFPEADLNFQPVQLFPDILPPQAPLCDPDQFLVPSYSLPPLLFNQDSVEQTGTGLIAPDEQTSSDSLRPLPLDQDCVERTAGDCDPQTTSQQLIKTPTRRRTVSARFAPIVSDREVQLMRERAKPANTRKSTNWATTVWIEWTEYRRSVAEEDICVADCLWRAGSFNLMNH